MQMMERWIKLVRSSALMDEEWYSATYGVESAVEHYLEKGWELLYDPGPQFSTLAYLQDYPDVARAGIPPLVHYEECGHREGRIVRPTTIQIWQGRSKTGISKAAYAPQSEWKPRMSVEELLEMARKVDYLSFDVFDTLLLRNVERPMDVFRLMGIILNEPRFAQVRVEAEQECYRKIGVSTNIYDIYMCVAKRMTIDIETTVHLELECERKICRANPYMKELFDKAKQEEIPIILVSDMYLPACKIEMLLNECGYSGWKKVYVSCEQSETKGSGLLQKKVWQEIGETNRVLHIGDNLQSDVEATRTMGWQSLYYPSCSNKMPTFIEQSIKTLPTSIANAICTNYLNNGANRVNKEFEHGFLYGGILVSGFCQWLNNFARNNEVDQIWFLARDMDIVNQTYCCHYNQFDSCYVRISRCAAMELNVEEYPTDFFNYHFYGNARAGTIRIGQALEEARLDVLKEKLWECGLKTEEKLTLENLDVLREFYLDHINEVCEVFAPAVESAMAYFTQVLSGHRRICIADLGWNGTIMMELKRFLRRKNFPIDEMFCVMMGATSNPITNDLISSGQLKTYLYSGVQETGLALREGTEKGNTQMMCLEAMFSSAESSLLRYDLDENGRPCLIDGNATVLSWQISEIQRGILFFAEQYSEQAKVFPCTLDIYPKDAFAPYLTIADDFQYLYLLFESVKEYEDGNAIAGDEKRLTTLGNIMRSRGLI